MSRWCVPTTDKTTPPQADGQPCHLGKGTGWHLPPGLPGMESHVTDNDADLSACPEFHSNISGGDRAESNL